MLLRFPSLAATLVLALVAMAPRASAGGKISNNERDARAALKEASALSEQAKTLIGDRCRWEVTLVKASETLKRAEILLANAPKADPALKRQLTKLAAAIAEQERDRRLLEQLEAIRLQTSARKDGQARPQYAAAFREYGLPLEELDAAKAAARLREQPSPVREAVLAALDHLALLLDDKAGKRLRDVLAAADPDPWRTRLREALGKRDQASLKKLASDLDLTQQTPAAVILLADGLVATGATSEAVAVLRKAHQLWPADFWLNHRLAQSLTRLQPPRWEEAVRFFTAALALRPEDPAVHTNLGSALLETGQREEAAAVFRQAIRLRPDLAQAHLALGMAFARQSAFDEAIATFREAIRLEPQNATARHQLGLILIQQHKFDEAIAAFREVIRLQPDHAPALNDLALALRATGRVAEAIAAHRAAIALQPTSARYYYDLGTTLVAVRKLDEAIATYRKAITLDPNAAKTYVSLGVVLRKVGQLDEALAALRKAIELNPGIEGVYTQLGHLLAERGDLDEAVAAYRTALQSDSPARIEAPFGLGKVLARMGRLKEAVATFKQVLAVRPDWAEAHWALGDTLKRQGHFAEALAALKRGHERAPKQLPGRDLAAVWVKEVERLVQLEARLPAILGGKEKPSDAAERIEYARVCQYQRLTAASARFYAEAFAADPKQAENLESGNRYAAACVAVRAGSGQGEDAARLDAKERLQLRQRALDWLRADLASHRKRLQTGKAEDRSQVRNILRQWQREPDLAAVRDEVPLGMLPADEQQAWRAFWEDVATLLKM